MPGVHTAKEKRMAEHIRQSAVKRGMKPKRALSMAWATVNKQRGEKKKK